MKNKYDSSVVFLYSIGREHLLPLEFRQKIPYSTISTWRKTNYGNYLGHEFRYHFNDAFKCLELESENKRLKSKLRSIARSWLTLSHLILPLVKTARNNKSVQFKILTAINYLKMQFGIDKTLKLIHISKPLFNQWLLEARYECFDSYSQLCVKRHPNQLQLKEIQKMKTLLSSHETAHWPIYSLQAYSLRNKIVMASAPSWYKYANLWGFTRKLVRKDRRRIGIVATCPNEYLQVDTTFYELIDNLKISISFVMDNYSKMILGFHISTSNQHELVIQSLTNALKVIIKHPDQKHSYLVTDGGKENHNQYLDEFIRKLSDHKITKIRALKDIRFSNSPVEAIHKIVKGRYLKKRRFESIEALDLYIKWVLEDYNKVRPHYKHAPRTPYEAYFNIPLDFDIRKRVTEAIRTRVKNNKCADCVQCTGCKTVCKK